MTEDMIFDVVAPGLEKIKMIERELKALGAEGRKAGKANAEGFEQATRSVRELAVEEAKLRYAKEKTTASIRTQIKAFEEQVALAERIRKAPPIQMLSQADIDADQARRAARSQAMARQYKDVDFSSPAMFGPAGDNALRIRQEQEILQAMQGQKDELAAVSAQEQIAATIAAHRLTIERQEQDELRKAIALEVSRAEAEHNRQQQLAALMGKNVFVDAKPEDLKTARLAEQYHRIAEQISIVTQRINLMRQASDAGSDSMVQDIQAQQIALSALRREQAAVSNQLYKTSGGFGAANMAIQQLSYGVDDFLTVLGSQGGTKGLINGLRAASNNISVVLSGINPLYAILPSLATAALGVGYSFLNMGDEAEKSADKMDEAREAAKSYRDAMAALDDQIVKLTSSEKKYAIAKMDRENEQVIATANQEVTIAGKRYSDAIAKADESRRERELLKRQGHWNERDDEMFFQRPEFQEEKVAKLQWEQAQQRVEKLRKKQKNVKDVTVLNFVAEELAGMPIGMGEFAKADDQVRKEQKEERDRQMGKQNNKIVRDWRFAERAAKREEQEAKDEQDRQDLIRKSGRKVRRVDEIALEKEKQEAAKARETADNLGKLVKLLETTNLGEIITKAMINAGFGLAPTEVDVVRRVDRNGQN